MRSLLPGLAVLVLTASLPRAEDVPSDYATMKTYPGTASTLTVVKRKGVECPTRITDHCKVGETCFGTISIEGDAAKQLYLMLRKHGTKSNEMVGDYVATTSEAMTCAETDGKYYCDIGYDAISNKLTVAESCEGE
jgi:hypothetical protein